MLDYMLLPFKRYADFSGRSRRMEYWGFTLFNLIVFTILVMVGLAAGGSPMMFSGDPATISSLGAGFWVVVGIGGLYGLFIFIPAIAVTVRRLHDRDLSGWWYLGYIVASMIPYVGFIAGIAMFVITILPGTAGPNRFGEDPKDPTSAGIFA